MECIGNREAWPTDALWALLLPQHLIEDFDAHSRDLAFVHGVVRHLLHRRTVHPEPAVLRLVHLFVNVSDDVALTLRAYKRYLVCTASRPAPRPVELLADCALLEVWLSPYVAFRDAPEPLLRELAPDRRRLRELLLTTAASDALLLHAPPATEPAVGAEALCVDEAREAWDRAWPAGEKDAKDRLATITSDLWPVELPCVPELAHGTEGLAVVDPQGRVAALLS